MKKIPILFINFNRPHCTGRSFEQIKKYRPHKLYIVSDGARASITEDVQKITEVREILKQIDWPCEVYKKYSSNNLGCKTSVQQGLEWFFKKEERGIILEDDCIPSSSFFNFTACLLKKYENNLNIAAVCGTSLAYKPKTSSSYRSYYFTPFMNMWGWATWRRTFKLIDPKMKTWRDSDSKLQLLQEIFNTHGCAPDPRWLAYWHLQFSKTERGEIDTWDYQWIFSILKSRLLCIFPEKNLVENIGWGVGATHTHETPSQLVKNKSFNIEFPLKHPSHREICPDPHYEEHIKEAWCDLKRFHKLFLRPKINQSHDGQSGPQTGAFLSPNQTTHTLL